VADDFSELYELAADLTAAGPEVRPFARSAIQFTAHNIREDWRRGANRTGLTAYARDVTYETKELRGAIEAEIGPTIGDAGSMGFVEEGGSGVQSAPQHAGRSALEANEPDFYAGLEVAVYDAAVKAVGK